MIQKKHSLGAHKGNLTTHIVNPWGNKNWGKKTQRNGKEMHQNIHQLFWGNGCKEEQK